MKQLNKVVTIIVSVMLAIAIVGCSTAAPAPAEPPKPAGDSQAPSTSGPTFDGEIYVGVTAGITGDAPLEGEAMTRAVTLASEIINGQGGVLGKKLVPVIEDDSYTPEGAITVANKFIADEKIVAMAGPGRSSSFMAISDLIKEAGMPIVTPATSTTFYKLDNPYWFRDRTTDGVNTNIATRFLVEELGLKNIGVMLTNDDAGLAARAVIESTLKELGVTYQIIVYNGGEIDYSGQVLQLRDAGADGLVLWGHTVDYAVICRNMYQLGYDIPTVGNTGFMSATFLDLVDDEVADGLYVVTDINLESEDPYVKYFLDEYSKRYPDIKPDVIDAIHFAHMFLIADAIKRAGVAERQAIADALHETKDIPSVLGPLTCDKNQDCAHTATVFQNEGKVAHAIKAITLDVE